MGEYFAGVRANFDVAVRPAGDSGFAQTSQLLTAAECVSIAG